jgi:hypothetical protein
LGQILAGAQFRQDIIGDICISSLNCVTKVNIDGLADGVSSANPQDRTRDCKGMAVLSGFKATEVDRMMITQDICGVWCMG